MTPEKAQALQEHINAIAAIVYEETPAKELSTLESLEKTAASSRRVCALPVWRKYSARTRSRCRARV
jgi:hypothetical protein